MSRTVIGSANRRKKIKHLLERDGNHCYYCRVLLTDSYTPHGARSDPTKRTIEHVVPQKNGGTGANINLVLACFTCNNGRGDEDFLTFLFRTRQYHGQPIYSQDVQKYYQLIQHYEALDRIV